MRGDTFHALKNMTLDRAAWSPSCPILLPPEIQPLVPVGFGGSTALLGVVVKKNILGIPVVQFVVTTD
jgi:hypothetical protein